MPYNAAMTVAFWGMNASPSLTGMPLQPPSTENFMHPSTVCEPGDWDSAG